jgi:hypothetical protein
MYKIRSDYIDAHLDTSNVGRDFNKRIEEKDINIFKDRFMQDQSQQKIQV